MKLSKFMFTALVLLLLAPSGWAGDKKRASIHIDQTVHIGSAELAPGEYKMAWTQSGSNTEVTFSQGKKVIVTVPAQATQEHSGYRSPALRIDGVSKTLVAVDLPEVSLSFTTENAVPANPGN